MDYSHKLMMSDCFNEATTMLSKSISPSDGVLHGMEALRETFDFHDI